LGQYRLSLSRQRAVPGRSRQGRPHPPQEARRQVDAQADGQGECQKTKVRARVDHVFAHQKDRMRLFIRSVGLKRAEATVAMANIASNLGRWRWWGTRIASA